MWKRNRKSVDFPEPDGPMTDRYSPLSTSRDTWFKTLVFSLPSPNDFTISFPHNKFFIFTPLLIGKCVPFPRYLYWLSLRSLLSKARSQVTIDRLIVDLPEIGRPMPPKMPSPLLPAVPPPFLSASYPGKCLQSSQELLSRHTVS